jgi:hypothetical protein
VVIIPEQTDKAGWTNVSQSIFMKNHLLLVAGTPRAVVLHSPRVPHPTCLQA